MNARRRATTKALILAVATATPASAAVEGGGGTGVWTVAFLALVALIILFQALPAVIRFVSLVRSLLLPNREGQRARKAV